VLNLKWDLYDHQGDVLEVKSVDSCCGFCTDKKPGIGIFIELRSKFRVKDALTSKKIFPRSVRNGTSFVRYDDGVDIKYHGFQADILGEKTNLYYYWKVVPHVTVALWGKSPGHYRFKDFTDPLRTSVVFKKASFLENPAQRKSNEVGYQAKYDLKKIGLFVVEEKSLKLQIPLEKLVEDLYEEKSRNHNYEENKFFEDQLGWEDLKGNIRLFLRIR
jgi:hypothetical protein